jgi:predicted RNase H-like nuclease
MDTIIGVDCATDPRNVGVALASFANGRTMLHDARTCSKKKPPAVIIAEWIDAPRGRVLLALDAPLGWPVAMGKTLQGHRAGVPIEIPRDHLFMRGTDLYVRGVTGITPFSVGADRIARTAHAALCLLRDLRTNTGGEIPLVWHPGFSGVGAIEVYPAATIRRMFGPRCKCFTVGKPPRPGIPDLAKLEPWMDFDLPAKPFWKQHEVDAALCVLTAHHFLTGAAIPPVDLETAKRESWIWLPAADPA